jgi:hypothetical protein
VLTSPQQEILKQPAYRIHLNKPSPPSRNHLLGPTPLRWQRTETNSAPLCLCLPPLLWSIYGPPGLSSSGVWVFASGLGNPHCALAWTGNTRDVQQATWQLTQSTSESESCSFDWYKPNGHATNTPNALPCTPDKPSCALPWHCTPTCDTHQHRAASHVHRSRA